MTVAAPPSRSPRTGPVPVARVVLVLAALVPVVAYLVVAVQRVAYPYELTYFEGSTVEVTARVVDGQALYDPPTTDFTPWPYPPLYFWLTAGVAEVVGTDLTALRLVSLAASLVMIALVGLVVRRVSGSTPAAVVAAGVFAATYRVSGAWFDTARVDSLHLALLLGAVLAGVGARTGRRGVLVGLLLVAAFLTKQSTVLAAAPAVLWLVVRRPAAGWATAFTAVGGVLGSTLVGQLTSGGWYARYVLLQLAQQGWAPEWVWAFWVRDLLAPFGVSVAAALVVLLVRRRRRAHPPGPDAEVDEPHRPARWRSATAGGSDTAYLLAAALGLVLSSWLSRLHEGGYANVAMPAHAAAAVVVGLGCARLLRSRPSSAVTVAVAVLLLVQSVVMGLWQVHVLPSPADRQAGDRFVADLRALPGDVLVPTHPYYARLAGWPSSASAIAVQDLARSAGGPALLASQLPWDLDGVDAVVLDNADDEALFGEPLRRDFTLVTTTLTPPDAFYPVTDLRTHPTRLYVRTTALRR